jgi:hypothetical protein
MNLDIEKQEDGSFRVVAVSTQGKARRTIGTIYRVDDAEALFAWKMRNDGLQNLLNKVYAVLAREYIYDPPLDSYHQGYNAGLLRVADALGITETEFGATPTQASEGVKEGLLLLIAQRRHAVAMARVQNAGIQTIRNLDGQYEKALQIYRDVIGEEPKISQFQ